MISFLCPTRGRPKQAINLYKSFINTQKNKNELLFCIQKEDRLYEEYKNVICHHFNNWEENILNISDNVDIPFLESALCAILNV